MISNCNLNYGFGDCCGNLEENEKEKQKLLQDLCGPRAHLQFLLVPGIYVSGILIVEKGYFDLNGKFNRAAAIEWDFEKHFIHKIVYYDGRKQSFIVFN
jgi:hypothetical protein